MNKFSTILKEVRIMSNQMPATRFYTVLFVFSLFGLFGVASVLKAIAELILALK